MSIVYFHNVVDHPLDIFDQLLSRVTVTEFARQMEFLRTQFTIIDLETYLDRFHEGVLGRRDLTITFDDGYLGVYAHAFPLLRELDVTATVFIMATDYGDSAAEYQPLHFEEIEGAFRLTKAAEAEFDFLPGGYHPLRTLDDRVRAMSAAKRVMKHLPEQDRVRAHVQLMQRLEVGESHIRDDDLLRQRNGKISGHQIEELRDANWTIGAHTRTHRTLGSLSEEEQFDEIVTPLPELQARFQLQKVPFAYPYGRAVEVGELRAALVEQAGYICGLTTQIGANRRSSLYGLERLECHEIMHAVNTQLL